MTTGLAMIDTASVARIALVGIGVGGTLTLSRLAEQADKSWSGTALDIVDRPESLGRGIAFGSDIPAAAVNTSQHRLEALSPSLHSFHSWLEQCGSPSTDLDEMPMSRSVYGDYLAATLAKAIDRLRDCGVRVRFYPMHARSVRPGVDGIEVLGETANLPPADIAVLAPGVWSPHLPATCSRHRRCLPAQWSADSRRRSTFGCGSRQRSQRRGCRLRARRRREARPLAVPNRHAAPGPGRGHAIRRGATTSHRGCGHQACGLDRAHSGVGARVS